MAKSDLIYEAIKLINPNAKVYALSESNGVADLDNIVWDEGTTPISKEDIEAKFAEAEIILQNKVDKKTSGKQKLKDLGLDDDEIQALIGK